MEKKHEEILKRFGNNLRELRMERNLSLRELAARCNTYHSNILKMESGKRNVTVTTIVELAEGLGVRPRKLLDF